ncbi:MAG: flagellar hook-associated protein FlgK, partial [Gemmatimonadota bacterium]|nr:flagellar hook-associated protein FlgK [Gemmatimonadota bacterium]
MPTLSNALQIGLSGLKANQMGLNVTGHNISNVNNEGYTRQSLVMESKSPIQVLKKIFGTGVDVTEVRRYRESFVDRQFREQNQRLGNLAKQSKSLDLVEGILNEPSDTGLHNAIKNFFNSLQDLSVNPESSSVRTTVREEGRSLSRIFNQTNNQLESIRHGKNFEITDTVTKVNQIMDQIGLLNVEIGQIEALGRQANDMRDSRDQLLDKLSKLVDITAVEDPANSTIIVSISGIAMVVMGDVNHLEAESVSEQGKEYIKVTNPLDDQPMKISGGELAGLFEIRDKILPELIEDIDKLAGAMITEINSVHRQGYGLKGNRSYVPTDIDFFQGENAGDMALSYEISSDPGNIATSKSGAPGDNENALALAQLR